MGTRPELRGSLANHDNKNDGGCEPHQPGDRSTSSASC